MLIASRKINTKEDGCKLKVTCTGVGWQTKNSACNRIIMVSPSDIRLHNVTVSDVKGMYNGVICPYCNCFTIVPKDKVPGPKFKFRVLT